MLVLLLSLFTWLPSIIWLCLHTPLCRPDSIYSACLSLEDKDKKQKGFNRQGRSGFSWQCRPFFFLSPPYSLGFWHIKTIEQDKIYRERPTISELFLRHPAEWPWRETCCGITRWENISSGKRKTTKKYQSHRQIRPREMECFADRIGFFFFFFTYFGYFAPFSFHSYSARRKRAGCRAISKYCGCLRFPRLTTLFLNIQPFILSYFSQSFFLFICGSSFNHSHIFRVSHHVATCVASFVFSSPWVNPIYPSGLFLSLSFLFPPFGYLLSLDEPIDDVRFDRFLGQ